MGAIEAEWKKLLANVTRQICSVQAYRMSTPQQNLASTGKANFRHLVSDNVFDGVQLSIPMNVVQTFDSIKGLEDVLESGPWMIRNSLIILKKWMMNTRPYKEELTLILVWVKIHDVPIQVFLEDGISLIASQIANEALKDSITMGIPLPEGIGFTKEINATTVPTVMNNDGFQTMVNKKKSGKTVSKEKPSKAANVPSSSFSRGSTKNRCLQYHYSTSNIHTSNPCDALDDRESDEEVEVVYDETSNLFGNNITRDTYTAPGVSKP
ncbi:zinc knuckle CX2CX4HX4C containing protein [Tanacetum coccineum]